MKIANTPGFTADASLHTSTTTYRTVASGIGSNVQVTPAIFRQSGGPTTRPATGCSAFCAKKANECTDGCSPSDTGCRDGCDSLFWCCLAGCGLMTGGGGVVMA
jgi:hypothetical protein